MSLDSSSDEQRSTQSNNKVKRSRKVIWTPTSEKETYRTVVVNYHYNSSMDKNNNNHRSTGTIPKKRDTFSQMMTAMSTAMNNANYKMSQKKNNGVGGNVSSEDYEDVPNLRKLYGNDESREELCEHCSAIKENSHHSNLFRELDNQTEDIKMEIYSVPTSQHAVVEKFELKSLKKSEDDVEVIVISDDDEDDDDADAENEEADATSTPSSKQMMNHPHQYHHHHNPYQTMRIVSSTKSTQNPELKNERHPTSPAIAKLKSQEGIEHIKIKTLLPEIVSSNTSAQKPMQRSRIQGQNTTFKQRQLELHRHRIAVEEKRLELLEVKLRRERDEMERETILFDKELQLKESQLRQLREDRDLL